MGTITSGVGLISGINTSSIIDQLMAINQQPVNKLQARIATANAQKQAFTDLSTKLGTLQQTAQALERPTTFAASTANSSDQSILTATAGTGAAVGTYQFQVARLVSAQQSISNGYSSTNALVGAGTITLSMGGGNINNQTTLAQLNGGNGVQRGTFRITDRSGNSSVVDISEAVSLDDVVKKINTSLGTEVQASIDKDHLVLTDTSGGTGNLNVQDLSGGQAAANLGIAGSVSASTMTGTNIDSIGSGTAVASLNDGRGLRTAPSGAADFRITLGDGSTKDIALGSAQTVGDIVKAINTAGGTKLKATIDTSNNSIDLTDTTGGPGAMTVTDLNGSQAADDLGFTAATPGASIQGKTLIAGIDTVLVSSLKGGSGISLGTVSIQDRSGNQANVDLSGAKSVQDILDAINKSGVKVNASLNNSGNGIQLQDTSGGTGNLVIGDAGGTSAQALGIAGTFDINTSTVNGANLHYQWISQNTLLSSYNGGKGVAPGSFTITNAAGTSATVDLSQGTFNTLGDVINAINAKKIGVTASINANGNGLLLTDTSGGAGTMKVANGNGTTASDLNIVGSATNKQIDGSFEKTIDVNSTDTLASVQTKIQQLGWGVVANVVNDGSGVNGYHLSLTATHSGAAGRVVIDGGSTSLQTRNIVQGQDAAVFYGGSGGGSSMLLTSSTNQLTGVIPGVTINLLGASNNPVTVNVTRDPASIVSQVQSFTDGFNGVVDELSTLTSWNTTTNQGGILLGDSTLLTVQQQMYNVFNSVVQGAGQYRTLADVGITLTDGAKITFDSTKFQSAYAANPTAVQNLFTQAQTGLGAIVDNNLKTLVDPVSGAITLESQALGTQVQGFQNQITSLNSLLADQKNRLEQQFANMETVLAGLQGQASALGSLTTIAPISSSKSSSSSTSK